VSTATQAPNTSATATEVCSRFAVPTESRKLLRDGMEPAEYIKALVAAKQFTAALDFIAFALPPRDGIWWGCLCMHHADGPLSTPADRQAARAAVQWVMRPCEQNRTAAKAGADAAGPTSASGSLALAAFQTPCDVAGVKPRPAPFAWATWVSRAVKLCALKAGSVAIPAAQRSYADLGLWVAETNLFRG
jgi:hypothetical protein